MVILPRAKTRNSDSRFHRTTRCASFDPDPSVSHAPYGYVEGKHTPCSRCWGENPALRTGPEVVIDSDGRKQRSLGSWQADPNGDVRLGNRLVRWLDVPGDGAVIVSWADSVQVHATGETYDGSGLDSRTVDVDHEGRLYLPQDAKRTLGVEVGERVRAVAVEEDVIEIVAVEDEPQQQAIADGGRVVEAVHPTDLSLFQHEILLTLGEIGPEYGLAIKRALEERYDQEINHGRLYPNLDTLVEEGLVAKSALDKRTNEYELTERGERLLRLDAQRRARIAGVGDDV